MATVLSGGTDGLCPGDQLFESIVQNMRTGSDTGATGAQTAGMPCAGISFAVGFDAVAVDVGEVAAPEEPIPSECD